MSGLSEIQEEWARASAESSWITPDDGRYQVLIDNVEYTECDLDGNDTPPTFVYTFVIQSEKDKDKRFRRFATLRNEKSARYFKADLKKMGIPIPENPEELPALLKSAVGLVIDVTVKSRSVNGRTYRDVYFDQCIERRPIQQVVINDEEIPF